MTNVLDCLYELLWGTPMLVLILGVGVWLTICTRCVQLRLFPQAVRRFFHITPAGDGGVSPFRALCTALAATVGTGNLVGIAGASGWSRCCILDAGVCFFWHGGEIRRSIAGCPFP